MFNIDIPAASEQSPCPISMSLHVPEEQRQDGMFAPITLSPQQPVPPPAYPTVSSEEALLAMGGTLHSYNNSRFIKDERFNPVFCHRISTVFLTLFTCEHGRSKMRTMT